MFEMIYKLIRVYLVLRFSNFYAFFLQVQDVTMEIQDLLQWLDNTDLRLSSSKTVWGMPDSASERLNAHLVGFICQNNCLCKKVKLYKQINKRNLIGHYRNCVMRWIQSSTPTRT